jgi:hypothetical protein
MYLLKLQNFLSFALWYGVMLNIFKFKIHFDTVINYYAISADTHTITICDMFRHRVLFRCV